MFCANTEIFCSVEENEHQENRFFKMSTDDNMIILDITENENETIPHMNLIQLKDIIFKKLKLRKACDVYKLTVEQLRYAGDATLLIILELLNNIFDNINFLSSSVASVVYNGK